MSIDVQLIPEQDTAFVILLNSYDHALIQAITQEMMTTLTGVELNEPELPSVEAHTDSGKVDFTSLAGCYEYLDARIDLSVEKQKILTHIIYKIDPARHQSLELIPIGGHCFGTRTLAGERNANMAFVYEAGCDRPSFLFNGGRLNRRHPSLRQTPRASTKGSVHED